jgi:hypothetical protein
MNNVGIANLIINSIPRRRFRANRQLRRLLDITAVSGGVKERINVFTPIEPALSKGSDRASRDFLAPCKADTLAVSQLCQTSMCSRIEVGYERSLDICPEFVAKELRKWLGECGDGKNEVGSLRRGGLRNQFLKAAQLRGGGPFAWMANSLCDVRFFQRSTRGQFRGVF